MAIYETYSQRQKKLRGEVPDVYVYDKLPQGLENQIIHIWLDTFFIRNHPIFEEIVKVLCREHGLLELPVYFNSDFPKIIEYFKYLSGKDEQIDIIELLFRAINNYIAPDNQDLADEAISELNERFKQHGIGYQFVNNQIIRIDSEYIHAEAMKPALTLLHDPCYRGVQDEFLKAHEHYGHGRNKEALIECCKAFESTMKAICDKRGWAYEKTAAAKTLIKICLDNQLIPSFSESQFNALRTLLESSIPTIRNKMAGHGQGVTPTNVPDHITAYALHMTASTLVFLITAEKNTP